MEKRRPISEAPKDGTEIIGIYKDGTREPMFWNEERYCILGRRAGPFPPGWSPTDNGVETHLPLDDNEIISFTP